MLEQHPIQIRTLPLNLQTCTPIALCFLIEAGREAGVISPAGYRLQATLLTFAACGPF
jgi:hypothetical protein